MKIEKLYFEEAKSRFYKPTKTEALRIRFVTPYRTASLHRVEECA